MASYEARTRRFSRAGPEWYVRTEGPIGLDDDSEPEPDVAVVPGDPDDYSRTHPSRPVLTVRAGRPVGLLGAESH